MWRDGELVAEEEHRLDMTLYFTHEIVLMLERAGFVDIELRSGYADESRPATTTSSSSSRTSRRRAPRAVRWCVRPPESEHGGEDVEERGSDAAQGVPGEGRKAHRRGRCGSVSAGGPARADGGRGELGLVGADHVGITVPDINQAIEWFEDVMGAVAPLTFGPFSDPTGTFMHDLLGVDPRAVISQITMLRLGHSAGIELFHYDAPDQLHTHPRNSDWSGHHIAFYVTDIDAAVEYMRSKGVEKFLGPFP